ncbi:MAG: ATP-binding cassette domain-containing protein [Saprospiraceae bacterium]|nr:ATP-binding cassette domain-containing protein [Saprospiraceae bacterium]
MTNLSKKKEDGEVLFSNVDFTMNRDEKIALIGKDSAAVNAFYDVLSGKTEADSGIIEFGQTITHDYLPNENTEFFANENDLGLIDWLRQFSEEKDEQFIRGFLGRMLFSGEEVYKQSSVLSGGEKVRCMLSKIMLKHPNFLLLDEPTNHLDLESITALNNAMTDFKGNMIFTSHDFKLTNSVANRVIEITPNGIIDSLMSYADFVKSDNVKEQRTKLLSVVAA